jgi:drug/metabolite transporter (DMT)-like permease
VTTLNTVIGCILALGSAICVAVLISVVARESSKHTTVTSAGLQLLIGALLSSPLLVFELPSLKSCLWFAAIGALLLGPGFALYWRALKRLDAATASIIGLNEAVIASLVGTFLTDARITPATVVGGGLVLVAITLEAWSDGLITVGE